MGSESFLRDIERVLEVNDLKGISTTLLNDYVVRVYFDERVGPDIVRGFIDKISHCCDIELKTCHIVDIEKRDPFIYY